MIRQSSCFLEEVRLILLIACGSVAMLAQTPAGPEPARKAVLISNIHYQHLAQPPIDESGAKAVEEVLKKAHFDVICIYDLNREQLVEALDGFQKKVQPGDVSLVYYSGYVTDTTEPFLVPVDYLPGSDKPDGFAAYGIAPLQQGLSERAPRLSMLLFEAAWRDDRLSALKTAPRSTLATWVFSSAQLEHFSTQTNNNMGLFTLELSRAIADPGLDLTELASLVTKEVHGSDPNQTPIKWDYDVPKFVFHAVTGAPPLTQKTNPRDSQDYVRLGNGHFIMGCVAPEDTECKDDEKPAHAVAMNKPFWIGQTEVTVGAYKTYVRSNKGRKMPGPPLWNGGLRDESKPVVNVSWDDAKSFCEWAGGRLPTEAEWEYAARAGGEHKIFYWGNQPDHAKAKYNATIKGTGAGKDKWEDAASPAKRFAANNWNLFDLLGNVYEWCADWYQKYDALPAEDPTGPSAGTERVARGGSYFSPAKDIRASSREHQKPQSKSNQYGFRCVIPTEDLPRQ